MPDHFEAVAAFPLCWPAGWPRSTEVERSRFKVPNNYEATQNLITELGRMGIDVNNIIVSTSVPLRKDGIPLAKPPVDGDVGVAVYFMREAKPVCLACDKYDRVEHNIHAIAKTIEAMRGIERWGSTDLLDRAFTGFAALPGEPWYITMGLTETASLEQIERRWRELMKKHHPDAGGTPDHFHRLAHAYERAREARGA